MQDFKRIGGEILSSPLNENFRRLRNDISIANTNLVFSDKYGIMATTADMYNLIDDTTVELIEGQVCYVVSSGELYRYSNIDNDWHRIADFGQTFRQAFLNSGIVLMEGPITLLSDERTFQMPRILVYFKNKPGEDPYLKGMYLINAQELVLNPANYDADTVYSIMVNYLQEYTIIPGIPSEDDPNNVFIGTFMLNDSKFKQEFIYTLPDIAYTADRSTFLLNGGQCSGNELYANLSGLARKSGYYYDEGINYPGQTYYTYTISNLVAGTYYFYINDICYIFVLPEDIENEGTLVFYSSAPTKIYLKQLDIVTHEYVVTPTGTSYEASFTLEPQNSIDNYPKSLDDTSNYNILWLPALTSINDTYYTNVYTPISSIENILDRVDGESHPIYTKGIIYDKYYNGTERDVVPGEYTIQKHLITPSGQNIIVFGTEQYIDIEDARTHLNDESVINGDFLYAEVTRIIVQNPESGDVFNPDTHCEFYTMNRLTFAGNISPIFDDEEFKIYDGSAYNPWFLQIKLDKLETELMASTYNLYPMKYSANPDPRFGIIYEYIADVVGAGEQAFIDRSTDFNRTYTNDIDANTKGYIIPSTTDINTLRDRITDIESEIWHIQKESGTKRYNESIRYRLYKLENDIYNNYGDSAEGHTLNIASRLTNAEVAIDKAEHQKANKNTKINGYVLGDTNDTYPQVPYEINLVTGDISEGVGLGSVENQWFTQARVSENTDVIAGIQHIAKHGTGTVSNTNPHGLSTDDINVLTNSDNRFVTLTEKDKLAHVPGGPNYTDVQLQNLATNKIEYIPVYTINDDTQAESFVVNMKTLKVHSHGANVTYNGTTAILECVGQIDDSTVLMREDYTPIADSTLGKDGYVDKALVADYAESINTTGVTASQYYGTDANYESTDPEVEPTSVGWHDLPVYVSTESAEGAANIDSILLRPEENSVALKHLATSRVVYTAADEETDLNDNVYNLVKNHYHKVYNSGTQGPYIEDPNHPGSYIQDTSAIIYTYKVPYGGMAEHAYYFEYNNTNYTFSTVNLGNLPVNTILTYYPTSGNIEVEVSSVTHTLTTSQVLPTAVDDDFFVEFIAQTDWSKINKWNFGNNLSVTVADGIATINAFNATSDVPVHAFINLDDVDFVYSNAQPGQMLVINADGDGIDVSNAPTLSSYMLISDYVNSAQPTKVNAAVAADTAGSATTAGSAALLQGTYSVNDNNTDASSLWSANKISSFVSARIAAEGVRTDYGTTVPTSHTFSFTPKRGDLYILTES